MFCAVTVKKRGVQVRKTRSKKLPITRSARFGYYIYEICPDGVEFRDVVAEVVRVCAFLQEAGCTDALLPRGCGIGGYFEDAGLHIYKPGNYILELTPQFAGQLATYFPHFEICLIDISGRLSRDGTADKVAAVADKFSVLRWDVVRALSQRVPPPESLLNVNLFVAGELTDGLIPVINRENAALIYSGCNPRQLEGTVCLSTDEFLLDTDPEFSAEKLPGLCTCDLLGALWELDGVAQAANQRVAAAIVGGRVMTAASMAQYMKF